MKPVMGQVNKLIYNVFRKKNPILADVIVNWPSIVGPKFSSVSSPLKISTSREKGKKINILYITSESSSVSMEMAFQQDIMVERIAVYLGYKAIYKIKFLVR